MNHKLLYLSQCLSAARRLLMLPHSHGEAHDIAAAFDEISLGLKGIDLGDITDSDALLWLGWIISAMDISGLEDPHGDGLFTVKAKRMSVQSKADFAEAVAELAAWFDLGGSEE